MPRDVFTPGEVAERHGIPTRTVLEAIRRGDLPAFRYNARVIRVHRDALEKWTLRMRMAATMPAQLAATGATPRFSGSTPTTPPASLRP